MIGAIASGGAVGFALGAVGSAVLPFGSVGLLVATAVGVVMSFNAFVQFWQS